MASMPYPARRVMDETQLLIYAAEDCFCLKCDCEEMWGLAKHCVITKKNFLVSVYVLLNPRFFQSSTPGQKIQGQAIQSRLHQAGNNIWVEIIRLGNMHKPCLFSNQPGVKFKSSESKKKNPVKNTQKRVPRWQRICCISDGSF